MWKNQSLIIGSLLFVQLAYASKEAISTSSLDVGIVSSSEVVVKPGINISLLRLSQGGPKIDLNEDLLVFKSKTLTGQLSGISPLIEELKLSYDYSDAEVDELIIKKVSSNQYLVELRRVVKNSISSRILGLDISHQQNSVIEARGPGSGMASGRRSPNGAICGSYGICINGKDTKKINELVLAFLQKNSGKTARYELVAKSNQKVSLAEGGQGNLILTVNEDGQMTRVVGIVLSELTLESSLTREADNPLYKGSGTVKTNPLYER